MFYFVFVSKSVLLIQFIMEIQILTYVSNNALQLIIVLVIPWHKDALIISLMELLDALHRIMPTILQDCVFKCVH
jgi:hypothetical protein